MKGMAKGRVNTYCKSTGYRKREERVETKRGRSSGWSLS
jgi:hypothetical protein